METTCSKHNYHIIGLCCLLLFLIAMAILLAVPPTSRDALIHHLALPKLYLQNGGIYEIPDLIYSYYPMNLDLLYMIPLGVGFDILAKYIHFSFALATAWLLYRYISKRIDRCHGILGALFFLTIPLIVKLSSIVYVDLGLIFFSTASLLTLFQWAEKGFPRRLLIIAGVCCGLAIGTKYNGLICLLLLSAFVPILYIRSQETSANHNWQATQAGILFVFCALAACSPWLIRDFIWTGNPVYPLFNSFFSSSGSISSGGSKIGVLKIRQLVYHESTLQIFLLPIRIFFEGKDNIPGLFDGKLTPFLFFLPLLAFLPASASRREKLEKMFLLIFVLLFFFFALFTTVLRMRYISPIIPPLVILAIYGLRNLQHLFIDKIVSTKTRITIFSVLLIVIFLPNLHYITRQFQITNAWGYFSSKTSRDEYLANHIPEYTVMKYINSHLPTNAKILCFYLRGRSYYLDRKAVFEPTLKKTFFLIMKHKPLDEAFSYLQKENIDYLLIRDNLFVQTISKLPSRVEKAKWQTFFTTCTQPLYSANGYSLYQLKCKQTGIKK